MISFHDRLRLAGADIQMDAFFRARCPECSQTTLYVGDDAEKLVCRSCKVEFADGSRIYPSGRACHCHVCHLVCAGNLEDGIKRCIPCQVEYEKTGGKGEVIRILVPLQYSLRFRDLLNDVPDPHKIRSAMDRDNSRQLPAS